MNATRELIAVLVAGGMDAAEAAGMIARAAVEMTGALTRKSSNAVRQQRFRDRNKALRTVTEEANDEPVEALQSVTNRNEALRRNAQDGVTTVTDDSSKSFSLSPVPLRPPIPPNNPLTPKPSSKNSFGARDFGDWPEDFQAAFWTIWPHKVGKPAAMKALDRVRRNGVSYYLLIAGVHRYIRGKPPDRSWMNPATFLNGGRWEDQPASEANGQSVSNHRTDPAAGRATAREAQHVAVMGSAALRYLQESKSAGQGGNPSGSSGPAEIFDFGKRSENAR